MSILDKVKDLFGGAKEKIEEVTGQDEVADKAEEAGRDAAEDAKDKLPGNE